MRMLGLLCLFGIVSAQNDLFDYDSKRPHDVRASATAVVREITFASEAGKVTAAYLVTASGTPKPQSKAGILYVHWYGPPARDSNRSQFLDEAAEMAGRGAVSLLVDTMWSDPAWFKTRRYQDDYRSSIQQVKELRRALDILFAQRGVDPKRIGYVGHDFGAMYGAVMGGVDKRPTVYALQAGTTSFSDWFLLSAKLEGEQRRKFIEELAPLSPTKFIGMVAPAPILFQFAEKDPYVPKEKATEFYEAAKGEKKILWYEGGHELNAKASSDRRAFLIDHLRLRKRH